MRRYRVPAMVVGGATVGLTGRCGRRGQEGFTISELVLVVAIVAALVLVAMTSVRAIRHETAASDCQSQLRKLKLATEQYQSQHGAYPADEDVLVAGGYLVAQDVPDWTVQFEAAEPTPIYRVTGSRCR